MALKDQIEQDLVSAMKEQNELILGTLRILKSAIHNIEIQVKSELDDTGILKVIQGQIKSRQDSIDLYKKGDRPELAEKEQKEIDILKAYLPEQMSEEEIRTKVKEAISATGAQNIQDMGKVMGKLMPEVGGKADGSLVSKLVKEELS